MPPSTTCAECDASSLLTGDVFCSDECREFNQVRGGFGPAALRARLYCKHGHPYLPGGFRLEGGARVCKTCRRDRRAAKRRQLVNA